jgi:hypothetical protein
LLPATVWKLREFHSHGKEISKIEENIQVLEKINSKF